VRRQDILDLI